jgi:RNA polymerase sigma factor (sigma-70 family)
MATLFEAARAGDRRATSEILGILRAFARTVCRFGGPSGSRDADWEDVAQEAARRFFESGLRRYRGQGSESSYLYSIVRTTVLEVARASGRRNRREAAQEVETVAPPTDPLARLEVGAILRQLPESCRDLLLKVFLGDASYAQLAGEYGIAESSVRTRMTRCLRQAREMAAKGAAA